jgi:hypothetical protein
LLSLLGVKPILGRIPSEQEVAVVDQNSAAISYEFWPRHIRFGMEPAVA